VKVPLSWLRAYCDPGLSVEEVGEALAMHSIELERISTIGVPTPDGFVVGKVLAVEQHPDADRLSVCEVDTGDGRRTSPRARRCRWPCPEQSFPTGPSSSRRSCEASFRRG
jgi:Putative tRNA binding domain